MPAPVWFHRGWSHLATVQHPHRLLHTASVVQGGGFHCIEHLMSCNNLAHNLVLLIQPVGKPGKGSMSDPSFNLGMRSLQYHTIAQVVNR